VHRTLLAAAATLSSACTAAPPRTDPAVLARGQQVANRFCYACHDHESNRAWNPLLPRLDLLRFGTLERADASIRRLDQLNASMTLPFDGPQEDRHALAAWLAHAACREHARRRTQGWIALAGTAAAALLAAAVAGWVRRRAATARSRSAAGTGTRPSAR